MGEGHGVSAYGLGGSGQQDEMTSVSGVQLSGGCKISFRGGHCAVAEAPAGLGQGKEGTTAAWVSLGKGWPSKGCRRAGLQGFPPETQQQGWRGAWLQACPGQLSLAFGPRALPSRPLSSLAPASAAGGRRVVPDGDDGHPRVREARRAVPGDRCPARSASRPPPPEG